MLRWGRVAAAYALLGLTAFAITVAWRGESPLVHQEPWLILDERAAETYSLLLGVAFGALVVVCTRVSVTRFQWARSLHTALRPFARGMSMPTIVVVAVLSSFGEELLFRGLIQPAVGVVPQAILFGLAHQLPGKSRWAWITWATFVGLALGAMFQLTGSLIGPLCAHALVNGLNLAFLKTHDAERRRDLGGLLAQ